MPTAVHAQREASCHHHRKRADWPANCRGSCSSVGHAVHAQDSPVTCRDVRTNAAQQVLRGTHRRHARRVLAGAREAPAGGCSSSGRGSDGKCTLLINRSVVTSPSSLRTSTSAQIAQTAERQLCSRRRLTGDADAAARTAPVGRDGMCTPASRLGPQGGSGRGEQAKVTFGPVLSYPVSRSELHIGTTLSYTAGMLQAGVTQKRLKCNIFKTLFRSARLGRVQGVAAARSAETTTTSDVAGT